jgi:hypothetical protein
MDSAKLVLRASRHRVDATSFGAAAVAPSNPDPSILRSE